MLAFSDVKVAVKWALNCQELLLKADWPEEIFQNEDSAIEYSPTNVLIYRGFRVRMVNKIFFRIHQGSDSWKLY